MRPCSDKPAATINLKLIVGGHVDDEKLNVTSQVKPSDLLAGSESRLL